MFKMSVGNLRIINVSRWTWATTTFYLDNTTYIDVAHLCANLTRTKFESAGATVVLVPQPISKSMVEQSIARGESPMGLAAKEQLCTPMLLHGFEVTSTDSL